MAQNTEDITVALNDDNSVSENMLPTALLQNTLGDWLRTQHHIQNTTASAADKNNALTAMLNIIDGTVCDPREPYDVESLSAMFEANKRFQSGDLMLGIMMQIWDGLFNEACHTGEIAHTPRALTHEDMESIHIMASRQPAFGVVELDLLHPPADLLPGLRSWTGADAVPRHVPVGSRLHLTPLGWNNGRAPGGELHWAFCCPVLISTTGPNMGLHSLDIFEHAGPSIAYVFESARCARQWLKRTARQLSENHSGLWSARDQASEHQVSPDQSAPSLGDESHLYVYLSDAPYRQDASCHTVILLLRVQCVVVKFGLTTDSARHSEEALKQKILDVGRQTCPRLHEWLARYGAGCAGLSERLPPTCRILREAVLEYFRVRARQCLQQLEQAPHVVRICGRICACCGVQTEAGIELRRCAGCWRVYYCSRACQSRHWNDGHKGVCSKEYELKQM